MPADAKLVAIAQNVGADALLWFFAALIGVLAFSACMVIWLQRHLQQRSLLATPPATGMLLGYGLGFVLIVAAASIFATIAQNIAADAVIGRFDAQLAEAIRQHTSRHAYRIFRWITHFGDTATLTIICISGSAVLIALRRPWLALGFAAAIGGNGMLDRKSVV